MNKENQNIKNLVNTNSEKKIDLESINKENPFVVPPDYFNELPGIISDLRMKVTVGQEKEKPFLIRNLRPLYYAAAAVVLLIATTMFLYNVRSSSSNNELTELTWDEIANDTYYVYDELDVYNIIETLVTNGYSVTDETNVSTNSEDDPQGDENNTSVSSEDIIDYLSDEITYTDEIYNL